MRTNNDGGESGAFAEYRITEHRHRFLAWAAGRAASVTGCRFPVSIAKQAIEDAGLNALIGDVAKLPEATCFDDMHREWRSCIIVSAFQHGKVLTHGVAAKLINVYFKCAFVIAGQHNHERTHNLHPPIDRLLLEALATENFGNLREEWKAACRIGWSKLDSPQYERVIQTVRKSVGNDPLWAIEYFWRGHQ